MTPQDRHNAALEPRLTRDDLLILAAVPSAMTEDQQRDGLRHKSIREWTETAWRIAEALLEPDVKSVLMTLHGLERLGYVTNFGGMWADRWPTRWCRTGKGDEMVGGTNGS